MTDQPSAPVVRAPQFTPEEIRRRFTRSVATGEQDQLIEAKEQVLLNAALRLAPMLPDGANKALAMRKLEEAGVWATKAILLDAKP